MMDLEQAAYDSRPPNLDDGPWLDDVVRRAVPWLVSALAVIGWVLFLVTSDNLVDAREEAAVYLRNFEQCMVATGTANERLDRYQNRLHIVEDGYVTWLATLAPLYERTEPARMVPARATEDGGNN